MTRRESCTILVRESNQNRRANDLELYEQIELQECPICGGAGLMEEENGWCFYAACLDCGAHTAEIRYERDAERLDAAQRAAHLWNIGKVLTDTPND